MSEDLAPFTVDDFDRLADLVIDAWTVGVDQDWSAPAGTLEWTCLATADHTVDCVFSYALFLASRRQDDYPNWGELHALPDATAGDMVEGLRAVATMLSAVIRTAPTDTRAILFLRPQSTTGTPQDFAARGGHELILHAHDVCSGLGVAFDPPADLCARLLLHTAAWMREEPADPTGNPWHDLLTRSGRPRPT